MFSFGWCIDWSYFSIYRFLLRMSSSLDAMHSSAYSWPILATSQAIHMQNARFKLSCASSYYYLFYHIAITPPCCERIGSSSTICTSTLLNATDVHANRPGTSHITECITPLVLATKLCKAFFNAVSPAYFQHQ